MKATVFRCDVCSKVLDGFRLSIGSDSEVEIGGRITAIPKGDYCQNCAGKTLGFREEFHRSRGA